MLDYALNEMKCWIHKYRREDYRFQNVLRVKADDLATCWVMDFWWTRKQMTETIQPGRADQISASQMFAEAFYDSKPSAEYISLVIQRPHGFSFHMKNLYSARGGKNK